jgi:hypothetical protein
LWRAGEDFVLKLYCPDMSFYLDKYTIPNELEEGVQMKNSQVLQGSLSKWSMGLELVLAHCEGTCAHVCENSFCTSTFILLSDL